MKAGLVAQEKKTKSKPCKGFGTVAPEQEKMKWNTFKACESSMISDTDLSRAKAAFFAIDRDGSGTIESNELGFMLRSLGQNPSEEELQKILSGADSQEFGGNNDGKVDMREFLVWFARGLKEKRDVGSEDILDAYRALGGEGNETPTTKEAVAKKLCEDYDLKIDVDHIFDLPPSSDDKLPFEAFKKVLMPEPSTTRGHA